MPRARWQQPTGTVRPHIGGNLAARAYMIIWTHSGTCLIRASPPTCWAGERRAGRWDCQQRLWQVSLLSRWEGAGISPILKGTRSATGVIWHWGESVVGLLICSKSGEMSTKCWALANWLQPCQVTPPCTNHVHTGWGRAFRTYLASTGCTALQYRASLSHSLGLFPSTYVSLKVRFWVFFFFFTIKRLLSPFNGCPKDPSWSFSSVPWWGAGFGSWCTTS